MFEAERQLLWADLQALAPKTMTPAAQKMMDRLIRYPSEHGLSDLHIRSGGPMCIRSDGNILSFEDDPITEAEIVEFVEATATPEQYQQFD